MSGPQWIEFTTPEGTTGRLTADQVEMIIKRPDTDAGAIHTVLGEIIRIVDASRALAQWRKSWELA